MNFERMHIWRSLGTLKASIEFKNELGTVQLARIYEISLDAVPAD